MEEVRGPTEAHSLQGPHREPRADLPSGFVPLALVLEPVGLRIEVQRPDVVVGRHSEAEVRLALPDISRRHCRLVFANEHWRVMDLDSLNGVYVNGERMQEAALHAGDYLQLGQFRFVVEQARASCAATLRPEVLQRIADAMK